MNTICALRGMKDGLSPETALWETTESLLKSVMKSAGYQEMRLPILEKTELFKRSMGEITDVIEKEMYVFTDRSNESIALRPEGTAGCIRAAIEHRLIQRDNARLFYLGPMFRYERPQKGRSRQFHHFGVEAIGFTGPDIDIELLLLTHDIFKKLNLNNIILQINSLGSIESRKVYREILINYLSKYYNDLDADSQRRLSTNPLRIFDSKIEQTQKILVNAPKLYDYLNTPDRDHFEQLKDFLKNLDINYHHNFNLVRGLDYYNRTVFEWVTTDNQLGAQNTLCAGGHYDDLIQQLGGFAKPAIGWAIGLERLILLLTENDNYNNNPHAYFVLQHESLRIPALKLIQQWRVHCPELKIILDCGSKKLKHQFRDADQSGAMMAIILGESEYINQTITIKLLRFPTDLKNNNILTVSWDNSVHFLKNMLNNKNKCPTSVFSSINS